MGSNPNQIKATTRGTWTKQNQTNKQTNKQPTNQPTNPTQPNPPQPNPTQPNPTHPPIQSNQSKPAGAHLKKKKKNALAKLAPGRPLHLRRSRRFLPWRLPAPTLCLSQKRGQANLPEGPNRCLGCCFLLFFGFFLFFLRGNRGTPNRWVSFWWSLFQRNGRKGYPPQDRPISHPQITETGPKG